MCDLKFTCKLLEEMSNSDHQSNMMKWLLQDDEHSIIASNRSNYDITFVIIIIVNITVGRPVNITIPSYQLSVIP